MSAFTNSYADSTATLNYDTADASLDGLNFDTTTLSGKTLITAVPEPATIGMLGLGAFITFLIRRNQRS
jgi:hypothetical protein